MKEQLRKILKKEQQEILQKTKVYNDIKRKKLKILKTQKTILKEL